MSASVIIFYLIAALILGTAILAVTTRRIFRAAIWLLFSLVGVAALYFWMQVEFVAAVQIIVYVGGIVVLIIFSIFLTQQSGKLMPKAKPVQWLFSLLAVLLGFAWMAHLLLRYDFAEAPAGFFDVSVASIGAKMLALSGDGYALPFEAVSVLLLAGMIGCIVIALKSPDSNDRDAVIDKISEIS